MFSEIFTFVTSQRQRCIYYTKITMVSTLFTNFSIKFFYPPLFQQSCHNITSIDRANTARITPAEEILQILSDLAGNLKLIENNL